MPRREIIKLGKRLAVIEVTVRSEGSDAAVAHMTGTYSIPAQNLTQGWLRYIGYYNTAYVSIGKCCGFPLDLETFDGILRRLRPPCARRMQFRAAKECLRNLNR